MEFCIGVSSKGNFYNKFISEKLNFIDWLRSTLLHSSIFISNTLGYKAFAVNSITAQGFNGYKVNIHFDCIGYGVQCFWIAFVIAFPNSFTTKLFWLITGTLFIWFINVLRIFLLLFLVNKTKDVTAFSYHHLFYNIISYCFIFLLMFKFIKSAK